MKIFNTLADLQAARFASTGQLVQVKGTDTTGDGGIDFFLIQNSGTPDGVDVFATAGSKVAVRQKGAKASLLAGRAKFTDTTQFATGTTTEGIVANDATWLSLVGTTITVETQGFHSGSTVGGAKYKFLNGADSTAAGYVDGSSRFQLRALDVYACLASRPTALNVGASGTNDFDAIQHGVNLSHALGYGALFCPPIDGGYHLEQNGLDCKATAKGLVGEDSFVSTKKTIFRITSTAGTETIDLAWEGSHQNKFSNIAFRYPDQKTGAEVGFTAPDVYPPIFRGGAYYSEFTNIDVGNAYEAFILGGTGIGSASKVTMSNITGSPMRTGLSLERVLDVPKVSDLHWNYNYLEAPYSYSQEMKDWIHANGDAFQIGRCDFGTFFRLFAFGYYRGIWLRSQRFTGSAENVKFEACEIDITQRPFELQNFQNNIGFIGGKYVGNKDDSSLQSTEVGKCIVSDGGDDEALVTFESVNFNDYKGDALQIGSNVKLTKCEIKAFGVDNTSGRNGIQVTQSNRSVSLHDVRIKCESGTGTRGVYDGGQTDCTLIMIGSTEISGATLESWRWNASGNRDFVETTVQITSGGAQARTSVSFIQNVPKVYFGINMPTSGSYNRGDFVENTEPSVLGSASSQYIIRGWRRITTGSGNVLNTDWVEERTLTGT